MKAKKERLFKDEDWPNPVNKDSLKRTDKFVSLSIFK
ncbi:hypothetical protein LCGC14_1569900 [marine sediment metagenome]|uniref:Uncharacterized protein n=1 Tax=marine sediment metagenome TaxID=412755 RepID=A0A0F9L132_9ZZZZ